MYWLWDLQKNNAIPTKTQPHFKQQSHMQEKQEAIKLKKCPEWNNVAYEVKRKRIFLFHTPSTGNYQFPTSFQPKGKNWNTIKKIKKKGVPYRKQRTKTGKVKIKQIKLKI